MDNLTKLVLNSLVDGAYRATGYILGPQQLKAFVRSFGEVTLEHILTDTGKAISAGDPSSAASAWSNAEAEIGLHSGEHTEVEPADGGFEVTYSDCNFSEACGTILADLITQNLIVTEDLPCMRCSLTSAAVTKATGKKTKYKMLQHAPGFRCRCSVHTI